MQTFDRQFRAIALLALLAALMGIAVLQLDSGRRDRVAQRDPIAPIANAAPATSSAPGELVAAAPAAPPAAAPPAPAPTPSAATPEPLPTATLERRGGVTCGQPHRVVQVPRDLPIRATPGGRSIAKMPSQSVYMGQATTAWVQAVTPNGRWGRVTLPWSNPVGRAGWIPLVGLPGGSTRTMVVADLSQRQVHVFRGCRELFAVSSAIGRPGSPSPQGRFWVTDRIAVPGAQQGSFGTYAFGLSTVQPNLPAGWSGGNQMAMHGTGAPGSIGQAASAGCLRVDERALQRLKPLLRIGTPVIIQA